MGTIDQWGEHEAEAEQQTVIEQPASGSVAGAVLAQEPEEPAEGYDEELHAAVRVD